ncbi:MAG: hypothetical protein LUQ66_00090 [Methanoregula sp.]|nr:hypothetical protein [Methanoregula sp.]
MTPKNSNFKSINEIKKEFEIVIDDPQEIRKELIRMAKSLHPDQQQNGGQFKSDFDESRYYRIMAARDFIDGISVPLIIPIDKSLTKSSEKRSDVSEISNESTELTKKIDDLKTDIASIKHQKSIEYESKNLLVLNEQIKTQIEANRQFHNIPKISLALITSILSFLWLFPSTIQNHPILSKIIDVNSVLFLMIWLYLMTITIIMWFYYYQIEKNQANIFQRLNNESLQNNIFDEFLEEYQMSGEKSFPLSAFTDYVYDYLSKNESRFSNIKILINREIGDIFSRIILLRAENSDIIKKSSTGYLGEIYDIQ